MRGILRLTAAGAVLAACAAPALPADWPMWRHDPARSAATDQPLPDELHLQWVRHLPALTPAWTDKRFQFDAGYEPIVSGKSMFVASSRNDSVTAYHTDSGRQRWRFHADGPVRLAPVSAAGRLYFGSDDGCLYCLDQTSGKLLWKFSARPARRVIGNDRLISAWPIRGGCVPVGGKLYFTAGIWPFEGVFLYALDLGKADGPEPPAHSVTALDSQATGAALRWGLPDLDSHAPCPQGHLAAVEDRLVIPSGRAYPSFFDTRSGRLSEVSPAARQLFRYPGSDHLVCGARRWVCLFGMVYDCSAGCWADQRAWRPVVTPEAVYAVQQNSLVCLDLGSAQPAARKMGYPVKEYQTQVLPVVWRVKLALDRLWIKAGGRLYGSRYGRIMAIDIPPAGAGGDQPPDAKVSWRAEVKGAPSAMLAADEKLFIVTGEGAIYCFGADKVTPKEYALAEKAPAPAEDGWTRTAADLLKLAGTKDGYCLVLGVGSGRLIEELARRSELRIIGVEPDPGKAAAVRDRLEQAGMYGPRIIIHAGRPLDFGLPPYLAGLIVSEDLPAAGLAAGRKFAEMIFNSLRPYGGRACLALSVDQHEAFARWVAEAKPPGADLTRAGDVTVLNRPGPLAGAGDWTHEYGDCGNTLTSTDAVVRPPLGVLWYGGDSESSRFYYPRHNQGPSAIIVDGRMFLQGPETLAAVDVYTGRLLWEAKKPTKDNTPGRRSWAGYPRGNHFAAVSGSAYVAYPKACCRLDPASGLALAEFSLPEESQRWGPIAVHGDKLLTIAFRAVAAGGKEQVSPEEIVVMDRVTGKIRWRLKPVNKACPYFAVGNGRVFCVDADVKSPYDDGMRVKVCGGPKAVTAFDLESGKMLWTKAVDIVPTWIAHSEARDVVVVSWGNDIVALRGADGEALWKVAKGRQDFAGHQESVHDRVILWHDVVIDQRGPGRAFDLATGRAKMATDPKGAAVPWSFAVPVYYPAWKRDIHPHGCGQAIAGEHLLTYRIGTAAYVDLRGGGSARLEGFRPGCRNSLIPAGGVLNAPMFANQCQCGYSIFTSLTLIHTPAAGPYQPLRGPRIGLPRGEGAR